MIVEIYCCPTDRNDDWYKKSLKEKFDRLKVFSIPLDDSTNACDTAQVIIFIWGVVMDFNFTEVLSALQLLKQTTTNEEFEQSTVFEQWTQLTANTDLRLNGVYDICTDRAPAMVGAQKLKLVNLI